MVSVLIHSFVHSWMERCPSFIHSLFKGWRVGLVGLIQSWTWSLNSHETRGGRSVFRNALCLALERPQPVPGARKALRASPFRTGPLSKGGTQGAGAGDQSKPCSSSEPHGPRPLAGRPCL